MKNKLTMLLAAGALVVGAQQAGAIPIEGTIRMAGDVTLDTQNLATASSASFSNPAAIVVSGTDSYSGTVGSSVNWADFSWNPSSAPVDNLWSFVDVDNGWTYTFDLGSITSVQQDTGDLTVKGLGSVDIQGTLLSPSPYTTTHANWSFTITDTSEGTSGSFVFGFADSNTTIPDGGATALLLGLGFLGLGAIARRK